MYVSVPLHAMPEGDGLEGSARSLELGVQTIVSHIWMLRINLSHLQEHQCS